MASPCERSQPLVSKRPDPDGGPELDRRAHETPSANHALFTSQLTDLFSALLSADISAETARLLRDH